MFLLARMAVGLVASTGFAMADDTRTPQFEVTGQWLYKSYVSYRDGSNAADGLAYVSYVSGVVDMLLVAQRTGMRSPLICPPLGLPMRDYLDTVGRHLEDHPEDLRRHRAFYVLKGLEARFGCAVAASGD